MPPRGATGLCGILAVDKPAGMTSHDVVSQVRRVTGERRVGHGGTLDPFATGLLIVAVGPATRLTRFFLDGLKSYEAVFAFGIETDTGDLDGATVRTADVPSEVRDHDFASEKVAALVGHHSQVPPAFSAVKVGGRKAYEAARAGESLDLEPRDIQVLDASLIELVDDTWRLRLSVTKGTYIRALARDLGEALGTAAHVSKLRRTSSGDVSVAQAVALDQLERSEPMPFLDSAATLGLPIVHIDVIQAEAVAVGRRLAAPASAQEGAVSLVLDGRLMAVYRAVGDELVPEVVLPGGCA